jgi:2-polyprenyl-3-methyl-5-hydroxy-6-metoxy-1,4-benzoquinol methylase
MQLLKIFSKLPLKEQLFVRARLLSAPLRQVARRARGAHVLDVGCGHGLMCALLSQALPSSQIAGVEPDETKVKWALQSVGHLPNVEIVPGTIDDILGTYDCITVCDVLYLIEAGQQLAFLKAIADRLNPHGQLLLKEAEDDGSWKMKKALWQERLMIEVLRQTKSGGGLGFLKESVMRHMLEQVGLRVVSVERMGRFSSTPHILYVAEKI